MCLAYAAACVGSKGLNNLNDIATNHIKLQSCKKRLRKRIEIHSDLLDTPFGEENDG
jgi:hypothetical protein